MAKRRGRIANTEQLPRLFPVSRYASLLSETHVVPLTGNRREIRQLLRDRCPDQPGVYGLVDSSNQLVYVGMSRSLRRRVQFYFGNSTRRRKESRLGRRAQSLIWQPAAHTLVAALRERELIQSVRPIYNLQGRPSRILWGYVVQTGDPAPTFSLQREIPKSHDGVWGPVPLTSFQRSTVEQLNFQFQLRDCPSTTPFPFSRTKSTASSEVSPAFSPCLRADLKTCLAPCIGSCSKRAYDSAVKTARQFLDGNSEPCFDSLTGAMKTAAAAHQFERAAMLRDRLQAFRNIDQVLKRFHSWSSRANFVYPIESQLDGKTWWMVFSRGVFVEAVPVPRDAAGKKQMLQLLDRLIDSSNGKSAPRTLTTAHEFSASRLLHRWFRLHSDQQRLLISLTRARARCRRRGKA
ncbi:GIY-YIG nuclease family protein [Planctomicrobium sp. SH527]|uniref:GIY-YIG nuclease family protein n=1 Tax=Planctomicrobium sp. SH527 TaxID=3448123 RepID=UPI003F5B20F4